jgi:hypothetical protein
METLAQKRDAWFLDLKQYVGGKLEYPLLRGFGRWWMQPLVPDRVLRVLPTLYALSNNMMQICIDNKNSGDPLEIKNWDIEDYLFDALRFLGKLDVALHPYKGPFFNERPQIWSHREIFVYPYSQIENMIIKRPSEASGVSGSSDALIEAITEYIQKPWLHNAYLDWVILDAMTFGKIVALQHEALMASRGGAFWAAYFLVDGVMWKTFLLWPLVWVIKWVLPGLVCYWIAQWSVFAAVATGAVWYGLYALGLVTRVWRQVFALITSSETISQKTSRLGDEAVQVYNCLRGPLMHVPEVHRAFEKAVEKGILWDHAAFYILDRLSRDNQQLWSNLAPPGLDLITPTEKTR